jgi:peroxiredoxin
MSDVLGIGAQAPDFKLAAHDGNFYRLSDVLKQGHAALIFYPGNNTPG